MIFRFNDDQPIYTQLAEMLEDGILKGILKEEKQIPSTTEISLSAKINPATALKGINLLVETGVLYKKRGVGMFVSVGARDKIRQKRRSQFYQTYLSSLLAEAQKLQISEEELIEMIKGGSCSE